MHDDIERQIRAFIAESFLFRDDASGLSATESLIEAGLIDSTGIMELVTFLEERFPLTVADAEITPENLDSIQAIVAYVEKKVTAASAAA